MRTALPGAFFAFASAFGVWSAMYVQELLDILDARTLWASALRSVGDSAFASVGRPSTPAGVEYGIGSMHEGWSGCAACDGVPP